MESVDGRQTTTGLSSLDAAEPTELPLIDVDFFTTKTDLASGPLHKADSTSVHALMSRASSTHFSLTLFVQVAPLSLTLANSLDHLSHRKFDQVQGEQPDNRPDPDDANPSTADWLDGGKVPISKGRKAAKRPIAPDRRHQREQEMEPRGRTSPLIE